MLMQNFQVNILLILLFKFVDYLFLITVLPIASTLPKSAPILPTQFYVLFPVSLFISQEQQLQQ